MRPTMTRSGTCRLASDTTSKSAGMPMSSNAAGWLAIRMKRPGRRARFFWCSRRSTSSARTKLRHQALNMRSTGCLPDHGSHESRYMSVVKAMKSIHPRAFLSRRASSTIAQALPGSGACILQRVGGQVVDAPEPGDEARVARGDLPEGEVGELEVDRLLGKP